MNGLGSVGCALRTVIPAQAGIQNILPIPHNNLVPGLRRGDKTAVAGSLDLFAN